MSKNKKLILFLFVLILSVVVAVLFFQCDDKNDNSVSREVIWLPVDIWPGNFWIAVADQKGFFEDECLNVKVQDVSDEYDDSIHYLVDGFLDANIISVFDVIDLNQQGADLVIVLYTDSSQGAEGIVSQKGINSIRDLIGKKVGVDVGTYLDFNLEVALNEAGFPKDAIEKVSYNTLDLEDAFANGEIDAASLWEPDLSKLVDKYEGVKIFDTSDVKGISPGVFAMRREFINEHPEEVQKIINVWQRSTEWIKNNSEETINIISKINFDDDPEYFYTSNEIMELMEQDLLMSLEDNRVAFSYSPGFESLYGNAQYVIRFLQGSTGEAIDIDVDKIFDPRFIYHLSD